MYKHPSRNDKVFYQRESIRKSAWAVLICYTEGPCEFALLHLTKPR